MSEKKQTKALFTCLQAARYCVDISIQLRATACDSFCLRRSRTTWWIARGTRGKITSKSIERPATSRQRSSSIVRNKELTPWKSRRETAPRPHDLTATANPIPVRIDAFYTLFLLACVLYAAYRKQLRSFLSIIRIFDFYPPEGKYCLYRRSHSAARKSIKLLRDYGAHK